MPEENEKPKDPETTEKSSPSEESKPSETSERIPPTSLPSGGQLPTELKTVHESPAPRDKPIEQDDDTPTDSREREKLLEDATLFLETGGVRNAPLKEKQKFLRSKGLTVEEVKALTTRDAEGKKSAEELKAPAVATATQKQQHNTPAPAQQQQAPIVTYPEFLAPTPPAAPPPLISGAALLKSLYFASAAATTVYGANRFIFTPMFDALTAARLEFSSTVLKNIDTLTTSLSELAPSRSLAVGHSAQVDNDRDDVSSVSDPTELFHVDAHTQTTPSLLEASLDAEPEDSPDAKLDELTAQMRTLVDCHSDGTDNDLTVLLEDLTTYLEGLSYDSGLASSIYTSPYGGYTSQTGEKDRDDPVMKLKQEIRSVKGVLLNTKNFPAGR